MKIRKIFPILFLAGIMTLMTSCATVSRGSHEVFVVESNPPGAQVHSSDGWSCTTPCSVETKRRGELVVTFQKPGYETRSVSVESSIDNVGATGMAGNIVVGGLLGMGIDAGTGAMYSHQPNPLKVTLVPTDPLERAKFDLANSRFGLDMSDLNCEKPEPPDSIAPDAGRDDLLKAKRQITKFQEENDEYQSCLKQTLERLAEYNVGHEEIAIAYNESITVEEALATEFNTALENYKQRTTGDNENGE